jgi:hypothetical protein
MGKVLAKIKKTLTKILVTSKNLVQTGLEVVKTS